MKKELKVNDDTVAVEMDAGDSLLDVLREQLELTGTKVGCEVGDCGACTVLVDGRPRLACITLAVRVNAPIITVEGLTEEAESLRRNFAEECGFQCGYCTPGQLVNARFIASVYPSVQDARWIRKQMSGNICRCTGYAGIVRAVQRELDEREHTRSQLRD